MRDINHGVVARGLPIRRFGVGGEKMAAVRPERGQYTLDRIAAWFAAADVDEIVLAVRWLDNMRLGIDDLRLAIARFPVLRLTARRLSLVRLP